MDVDGLIEYDDIMTDTLKERYDRLLAFVKMLAKERPDNDPFFKYINESAHDLLKEIGELDASN